MHTNLFSCLSSEIKPLLQIHQGLGPASLSCPISVHMGAVVAPPPQLSQPNVQPAYCQTTRWCVSAVQRRRVHLHQSRDEAAMPGIVSMPFVDGENIPFT